MGSPPERAVLLAIGSIVICASFAHVGRAEPLDEAPSSTDESAVASPEETSARRLEAAQSALRGGAVDDALAEAKEVLALDAANWRALALIGVAHQRSGRASEAAAAFELARRHAPEDRIPSLTYNLAVALLAAGRLEEAERTFARTAGAEASGLALLCWIGAAEAALGRSDAEATLSYLERARVVDSDGEAADLLEGFRAEAHAILRGIRRDHDSAARRALSRGDCDRASEEYRAALSASEGAATDERVDLLYGLGLSLYVCDRSEEALLPLEAAVALRSADATALYLLGRVAAATQQYPRAEAAFEAALRAGLPVELAMQARRRLVQVHALRRDREHAVYAALAVEGGYDTNPRQSGVSGNDTLSLGGGEGGSAFGSVHLGLGLRRPGLARVGGSVEYAFNQDLYLEESARELSLQVHRARADLLLRRGRSLTLSLGGTFELMALGLAEYAPVSTYAGAQAGLRVRHSDVSSTEMAVRAGGSRGVTSDRDHLTGAWWEGRLRETIFGRRLSGGVSVGYSEARLGALRIEGDALPAPVCVTACNSGGFVIPFGYRAAEIVADVRWASARRPFELRLMSAVQGRSYLESGYATSPTGQTISESLERRRDLRLDLGLELGIPFGHLGLVGARYSLATQVSTIDGTGAWDYDDQRFVRQRAAVFVELQL